MQKKIYKLILAGNTNIPSMINSIIASTLELRKNINNDTCKFNTIHILHTEQSLQALMSHDNEWKQALSTYNISSTCIIHHVTNIDDADKNKFNDLIDQLKTTINPLDNASYYIDLTSGMTSLKSILAVFSYVVDIEHIYSLEVKFSRDNDTRLKQYKMFYPDLVKEGVVIKYIKFPSISDFDDFGKLNYTEVIRHKKIIDFSLKKLKEALPLEADLSHLEKSLLSSVNSRLIGDITSDIDNYKHSVFTSSAGVEEMSNFILTTVMNEDTGKGRDTLGEKLEKIRKHHKSRKNCNKNYKYFIDPDILNNITVLINNIRNKTVHPKSKTDKELSRIKSHILSELSHAFLYFTIESISGFAYEEGEMIEVSEIEKSDINKKEILYFGFDGDNTGRYLELSFGEEKNDENELNRKSKLLSKTIKEITSLICKSMKNHKAIIFSEGDNILFKGQYNTSLLKEIQDIYLSSTGLSCSIGFGKSLKESSVALRLSKSKQGNSITGIKFIKNEI